MDLGILILIEFFLYSFLIVLAVINRLKYSWKKQGNYMPKVTVLLVCYKEGKLIEEILKNLVYQTYKGFVEIIVHVDNVPETHKYAINYADTINKKNRKIIVVNKWERKGLADSQNRGLDWASGEILFDLDGDTFCNLDMIEKAVAYFEDENVICASGALIPIYENSIMTKMQEIEYRLNIQLFRTGMTEINSVNNISGAFGIFRTDYLRSLDGWDHNTAEDLDLTIRIKADKTKIIHIPDAIAYTEVPDTLKKWRRQRLRWDGDLIYILKKHAKLINPFRMGMMNFLGVFVFNILMCVVLPLLIWAHLVGSITSGSEVILVCVPVATYFVYVVFTGFLYMIYLILLSNDFLYEIRLIYHIPLYPAYQLFMRIWMAFGFGNEVFFRGHENTDMQPNRKDRDRG